MNGIRIRGLVKRYPQTTDFLRWIVRPFERATKTALEGVDVDLERGRIYGLVGHNGAGKTTLMKVLAGLVLPTEGSIQIDGEEHAADAGKLRQRVGMVVAEERSFFWRISLRDNLRFFATLENLRGAARARRVEEVLEEVGLADEASTRFKDLSTGMRQRMSIARGLLASPTILLLDEPTRSLDPAGARDVRERLARLVAADPTRIVVYSSHVLSEIEALCTDVLQIERGRLVGAWNVADVEASTPRPRYRLRTLRALDASVFEALEHVAVERVEDDRAVLELTPPLAGALDAVVDALRASGQTLLELAPASSVEERVLRGAGGKA